MQCVNYAELHHLVFAQFPNRQLYANLHAHFLNRIEGESEGHAASVATEPSGISESCLPRDALRGFGNSKSIVIMIGVG